MKKWTVPTLIFGWQHTLIPTKISSTRTFQLRWSLRSRTWEQVWREKQRRRQQWVYITLRHGSCIWPSLLLWRTKLFVHTSRLTAFVIMAIGPMVTLNRFSSIKQIKLTNMSCSKSNFFMLSDKNSKKFVLYCTFFIINIVFLYRSQYNRTYCVSAFCLNNKELFFCLICNTRGFCNQCIVHLHSFTLNFTGCFWVLFYIFIFVRTPGSY